MGMPRISRGNESAGAIRSILGTAGGSRPGGAGMPSVPRGTEAGPEVKRIAAAAGSTKGTNPGSPPNRGLTAPGVVEAIINATMDADRKTPPIDPLAKLRMPGDELRKA